MKTSIYLPLLALLLSFPLHADDSTITQIRQQYKAVRDALPTLSKQELELSGHSTDGGGVTAYRDNKKNIQLLHAEMFGESGKRIEEHYYKNGVLFFAYQADHRYNVPYFVTAEDAKADGIEAFDPKKTKIYENRYYFANGKLIQWLNEDKKTVSLTTTEARDAEKDLVKFSTELLNMFK